MPKFSGAPSGAPKGSKTIDLGFDSLLFWGRMGEGSDSNFYKNTSLYKNTPPIPPPILIRGGILKWNTPDTWKYMYLRAQRLSQYV